MAPPLWGVDWESGVGGWNGGGGVHCHGAPATIQKDEDKTRYSQRAISAPSLCCYCCSVGAAKNSPTD